jgi:RHS repeat-associated protein
MSQEDTNWGYVRPDPMKFAGHQRDFLGYWNSDNTDYLDYMHARYYNPNQGRFLSVDPKRGHPDVPQTWNRYAYVMNNPQKFIDPTGENAVVVCDQQNNCSATIEAQIVADPNDSVAMRTATDFRNGAINYWQERNMAGPNGEQIAVHLNVSIVAPGKAIDGVDTLNVVSGPGRTNVQMSLFRGGGESPPDTGSIYTEDTTNNPSGMNGIGAHEVGHLMGLPDMYARGESVPFNVSPTAELMRHAQPTNTPFVGSFLLSPANGNVVVMRLPRMCFWGPC